jgi:23S rRNA (adenine2030-N6)-methyltransferase
MCVLLHLRKKEKPFAVIDTHAGRGIYDIGGIEAQKTGEAVGGFLRLLALPSVPGVLSPYLDTVGGFGDGRYPGSPLIAAQMLRKQDRLAAIEFQSGEQEELAKQLRPFSNARVMHGDGYRELLRLLPPVERRGVILIDPPYEEEDEFAHASDVLIKAHHRFATGIYMLWYPAKELPKISATAGELLNAGILSLIRIELDVGAKPVTDREGRGPPMSATGLLIINPPFGFAGEMQTVLPFLAGALSQGPGGSSKLDILAAP